MKRLFIIGLVLVLLCIPVSAYTSVSITDTVGTDGKNIPLYVLKFHDINAVKLAGVTAARFQGSNMTINSLALTGTFSGHAGSTCSGNMTASWSYVDGTANNGTVDIYFEFNDLFTVCPTYALTTVGFYDTEMNELEKADVGLTGDPIWGYKQLGNPTEDLSGWWLAETSNPAGWVTTTLYSGAGPLIVSNFTAAPTNGVGPLDVVFTDASSAEATAWNWSISPETGVLMPTSRTTEDFSARFTVNGNYTVTHGASSYVGSDTETKTDYIWVYDSNATKTTAFKTMDFLSGNIVHNTTINLYDIQNTSWANTTQSPAGKGTITTLGSHTINAYASAWGYADADLLAQPARDEITEGGAYTILMKPSLGTYNNSAGNLTLLITVRDGDTLELLEGAKVDILLDGGRMGTGFTNSAGTAYFIEIANNTDVRVSATKAGFGAATQFDNTGPGNGGTATKSIVVTMYRDYVTPTPVVTTLPGGGMPTTGVTPDPAGNPGDPGYSNAKGQQMMDLLAFNGLNLVTLCIMVTVLALLGVRLGK